MSLLDKLRPPDNRRGAAPLPWERPDYWELDPKERYGDPPIPGSRGPVPSTRGFLRFGHAVAVILAIVVAVTTFGLRAESFGEAFRRAFTIAGMVWLSVFLLVHFITWMVRERVRPALRVAVLALPVLCLTVLLPRLVYQVFYAPPEIDRPGDVWQLQYEVSTADQWLYRYFWNTPEANDAPPSMENQNTLLYACSPEVDAQMRAFLDASEMVRWYLANGGEFGTPDGEINRPGMEQWPDEYPSIQMEGDKAAYTFVLEFTPVDSLTGVRRRWYAVAVYVAPRDDGLWCVETVGTPTLHTFPPRADVVD